MREKIIIVGTGLAAKQASLYLKEHDGSDVMAFASERPDAAFFAEKPVYSLDALSDHFDCHVYKIYMAVGYRDLNALRRRLLNKALSMGFVPLSYISPHALVSPETTLGAGIQIGDLATVQYRGQVGDNVIILPGAILGHHCQIEADCYLCQGVNISGFVTIGSGSFVGTGAIFTDGVTVGKSCFIGAGACVHKDMPDNSYWHPSLKKPVAGAKEAFTAWYGRQASRYGMCT